MRLHKLTPALRLIAARPGYGGFRHGPAAPTEWSGLPWFLSQYEYSDIAAAGGSEITSGRGDRALPGGFPAPARRRAARARASNQPQSPGRPPDGDQGEGGAIEYPAPDVNQEPDAGLAGPSLLGRPRRLYPVFMTLRRARAPQANRTSRTGATCRSRRRTSPSRCTSGPAPPGERARRRLGARSVIVQSLGVLPGCRLETKCPSRAVQEPCRSVGGRPSVDRCQMWTDRRSCSRKRR